MAAAVLGHLPSHPSGATRGLGRPTSEVVGNMNEFGSSATWSKSKIKDSTWSSFLITHNISCCIALESVIVFIPCENIL